MGQAMTNHESLRSGCRLHLTLTDEFHARYADDAAVCSVCGLTQDDEPIYLDADECETCHALVPYRCAQYVPGDRNSTFDCRECGADWQSTHRWDDAAGEWLDTTNDDTERN
jgi:hypothetical protein